MTKRLLTLIFLVPLLFAIALSYHVETKAIGARIAMNGESPLEFIERSLHPENFVRSFPSGMEILGNSSVMSLYPLLARTGIDSETLVRAAILLQICLVAAAFMALARSMGLKHPAGLALAAILAIASNARHANLARFHLPFWAGLYYSFADFFGLAGLAAYIRGHRYLAGLLLFVALTIHPVEGSFAAVLFSAFLLWDWRIGKAATREVLLAGSLFLIPSTAWIFGHLLPSIPAATIPLDTWVYWTKGYGYHWYPISLGIFGPNAAEDFLPFLSWLALNVYFLTQFERPPIDRYLRLVPACILPMCLLGVLASSFPFSASLIKLSLFRSSGLFIAMTIPLLVMAAFERKGDRWSPRQIVRDALLIGLLLSLFSEYGPPLWLTATWICFDVSSKTGPKLLLTAALAGVTLGYALAFPGIRAESILLPSAVQAKVILLGFFISLLSRYLHFHQWAVGTAVLLAATCWVPSWEKGRELPAKFVSEGMAYREAQLWVRGHSQKSALFMQDPTIYYGWRDYASRSTFGNLREWFYTWVYTASAPTLSEGTRRFEAFGLHTKDYLNLDIAGEAFTKMSAALEKRFNEIELSSLCRIAREYRVNFWVFRNSYRKDVDRMPNVFRNSYFTIVDVERVCPVLARSAL